MSRPISTSLIASGLLTPCQPDDAQEQARFVHYATIFRSDGEAMCLALAESRGWVVATDDRKAIRIAGQAGLTVISCPRIVKAWANAIRPDPTRVLVGVLTNIQTLARFGGSQPRRCPMQDGGFNIGCQARERRTRRERQHEIQDTRKAGGRPGRMEWTR